MASITSLKGARYVFPNSTETLLPTPIYTQVREWFFHMMKHDKDRTADENPFLRLCKFKIEHAHPNQSTGRHYERDYRCSVSVVGYGDNMYDPKCRTVNHHYNHGYNNWCTSIRHNNNRRKDNRRGHRVNCNRSRSPSPIKESKYDNCLRWKEYIKSRRSGKRNPSISSEEEEEEGGRNVRRIS